MSSYSQRATLARSSELKRKLRRFKLIFFQVGAASEALRLPVLEGIGGTMVRAEDLSSSGQIPDEVVPPLVITDLEDFATGSTPAGIGLGALRSQIDEFLDAGVSVCLVSRAPRIAFSPVPGSSLIEDASFSCIPCLEPPECPQSRRDNPRSALPSIGLVSSSDFCLLLRESIGQLGLSVLASLDHALFETGNRESFLSLLAPREVEALRGANFLKIVNDVPQLTVPNELAAFSEAVADVLADVTIPHPDLSDVSDGVWFIERMIRRKLRATAIDRLGVRWRAQILYGDLPDKVLSRARSDTNITASSVRGLRDPIEWLSLGELLELVARKDWDGLGIDVLTWQRFARDVIPIRNRLSHMRLMKQGDKDTIAMWVHHFRNSLS